jgi:hypothetical protein
MGSSLAGVDPMIVMEIKDGVHQPPPQQSFFGSHLLEALGHRKCRSVARMKAITNGEMLLHALTNRPIPSARLPLDQLRLRGGQAGTQQ